MSKKSQKLSCFARFIEKIKEFFCGKRILFGADKIVVLTRTEYEALPNPDVDTLYFIK